MNKMIQIQISKVGTSFTGGLYPSEMVERVIAQFKSEGYTIVSVS